MQCRFVVLSLQEARDTVDLALNRTVEGLFASHQHTNRTPAQLLRIFRYPSGSRRELARAGEIYQRTLELVEAKVREGRLRVDVLAVLGAALGGIGAQVAARARLEELRLPKRFAQQ